LPPSSGVMNPKPFESLNHFTVPVAMSIPFLTFMRSCPSFACGHDIQGRDRLTTRRPLGYGLGGSGIHCLRSCRRYFTTPLGAGLLFKPEYFNGFYTAA